MANQHVNLKRGDSEAELKAKRTSVKEKIAPFSFQEPPKPLRPTLGLEPNTSTVEINNRTKRVAPFHYD
jgi:hypothetical protein